MDQIGIVEIEAKVTKLRNFMTKIKWLLEARQGSRDTGGFKMFKDLRGKEEVARQIEEINESYYSSDFDAFSIAADEEEEEKKIEELVDGV